MSTETQKLKEMNKHKDFTLRKIIKKSAFPVFSLALFSGTVFYWNNQNYGLALEYNGKNIVNVTSEDIYEKATHMVKDQLTSDGKLRVENAQPQLKIVPISKDDCCESPNEVKNRIIENSKEIFTEACGIYAGDKLVGVGESEEDLEEMLLEALEEQKNLYPGKIIEFEDKIELRTGYFAPEDIKSKDQLEEYLLSEVRKEFKYKVLEGDTISKIAEKFGITEEDIQSCNDIVGEDVAEGDTLIIVLNERILDFRIFEIIDEKKEIPFETITRTNDDEYDSWSSVAQEGKNGEEMFKYRVEYKNGKEFSRTELYHELITEPTEKIIEVGTKEMPQGFMWPVPYTQNITSPFGPRWGTMHRGIDIAAAGVNGTNIVASEGGTVERVSCGSTGYGNHIIIKHDSTYSTLYAHCQSVRVKEGQKVKKGEAIATVGSTGDSTGPHLHFEVRVNGVQQNPKDFV